MRAGIHRQSVHGVIGGADRHGGDDRVRGSVDHRHPALAVARVVVGHVDGVRARINHYPTRIPTDGHRGGPCPSITETLSPFTT